MDRLPDRTEPGTLVRRKAPIPAYVWRRVEDEFHLAECNEAARAITRGGIERYLGSTAGAMDPDRPQVVAFLERCWETKEKLQEEMAYRMLSTDEEKVLLVTGELIAPDLLVVHTEDWTAARRTEHALHEVHGQLERVFDTVGEGILVLDERRRVLSSNRRALELLAVPADALQGRDFLSLCPPADAPLAGARIGEARPGAHAAFAAHLVRGDGKSFRAHLAASIVVCPQEGAHLGWVVAFRDLTGEERVARDPRVARPEPEDP